MPTAAPSSTRCAESDIGLSLARPPRRFGAACLPMTSSRQFARDILASALPLPFSILRQYLLLAVFARSLGPKGFGEWSMFMATLGILINVASLNLGSAMMRFLSGERPDDEVSSAYSTVLLTSLASSVGLGAGIVALSAPVSRYVFESSGHRTTILLLGVVLCTDLLFECSRGLLRARRENLTWAALTLSRLVPEALVFAAVAFLWNDSVTTLVSYAACSAVAALVGWLVVRRRCRLRWTAPSRNLFGTYAAFGAALLPGAIAFLAASNASRYLVAAQLGLREVGIYNASLQIASIASLYVGPITDVLFPELSQLHDSSRQELFAERFGDVQKLVLALSGGAAALMAVFPASVLRLVVQTDFLEGSPVLAVLGVNSCLTALLVLYMVVLNVKLRVWFSTALWTTLSVLMLVLGWLLVPSMGTQGAAVGQLAATGAACAVTLLANASLVRRTFRRAWVLQVGGSVAAVWLFARVWGDSTSLAGAVARLAAGGFLFLFVLVVTGFAGQRELGAIRGLWLPHADQKR